MKQSHYLGSSVLRYGYPKTTVQHTPCRVLFTRTHSSPEQHAYLRRYLGCSYSTRFTRGEGNTLVRMNRSRHWQTKARAALITPSLLSPASS